jgi:5-methylcytosine-specific restriction protein A
MGGMRRNTGGNLLVLISDLFKGLYQDRWEGNVLHYTGMGKNGDQSLDYAQNKTLANSEITGISLHLLEALDPQEYTYVGEVELIGRPRQEEQPDDSGHIRTVWMFPLKLKPGGVIPALKEDQARAIEENQEREAKKLSTDELKARAGKAPKQPSQRATQGSAYIRDPHVAEYAKRLANGTCDLCQTRAPFQNKQNDPYLECHHVIWLAKGGQDSIANTVALCPNCHRKMHVLNQEVDQQRLRKRAEARL